MTTGLVPSTRPAPTSPSASPRTLRHVFPSELLHAGANLRQIQELLGHKHLDSTQRYTRVNAHELRGAIKRLRWVG
jgi:integrase/recombinase XerC